MTGLLTHLLQLFPSREFSLLAVVLGMPLLGAFINGVWGKRLGKDAVRLMTLVAMGVSFFAALLTFLCLDSVVSAHPHMVVEGAHEVIKDGMKVMEGGNQVSHLAHEKLYWTAWEWLYTSGRGDIQIPISAKFSVDALSGVMMLVITGVGFLIHLYASSYMKDDPGYWRFFAYLNLFVFSMLILVLGDNLVLLFVGWEGVGLCSYLLIGFWYGKTPNAAAGKKAFIANRIGDFGLICAMFLLAHYCGALDWNGLEQSANKLVTTTDQNSVHIWPIGGGEFRSYLHFLQPSAPVTISAATAVGLALLLGATGKSAQMPLYVWLPDAMAGPTPVSALIHAATMVTAGIYLVCRLNFLFVLAPGVMALIATIGALTAVFAATIALVQNDIKKVLAYSTVSQLGFMFLGVGMGAFTAGFFHVFTHAFFKACLFLGAGSVIHAMHARIHDDEKSQDMRQMGGLRKYMPVTYWTFFASTLAIIGFPLTSGFFSKDEILFKAMTTQIVHPMHDKLVKNKISFYEPPANLGVFLYWMGIAAATMTAFYMCRLLIQTFFGEFKGWKIGRPSQVDAQEAAAHGHDDHHHDDLTKPGHAPHESPLAMTAPLIILAAFAIFAGILNPGLLKHVLHLESLPMEHWLDPLFEASTKIGIKTSENADKLEWLCTLGAFGAFAVGSGLAYWMYIVEAGRPAARLAQTFPWLHKMLLNKWKVDEFYDYTVLSGVDALADTSAALDRGVVDLLIAKVSAVIVAALGTLLRAVQNGVMHFYAAMMVVGLGMFGWFFVAPHADGTVVDTGNGQYVISAAGGLGYSYNWREVKAADAAAEFDAKAQRATDTETVHVEEGETKIMELRTLNVFGLWTSRRFPITRPKPVEVVQVGEN